MSGEVAQLFDGVPVQLADGSVIRCTPFSLRHARTLLTAYRRTFAPPVPDTATPAERSADEAAREAALDQILELFPAAAGIPADSPALDQLSGGDVLRVLPGFFWKRTGAQLVQESPSPIPSNRIGPSTGTPPSENSSPLA